MIQVVDLGGAPSAQVAEWMVDLAANLRPQDLDEIEATSGGDPAETLVASVMLSDRAWVVLVDEEPALVFGRAPTGTPQDSLVWLMGSPLMDRAGVRTFILRRFRPYLAALHADCRRLWNLIDARNAVSLRWLEWLGFRVVEAHPAAGREARLFYTFERIADV